MEGAIVDSVFRAQDRFVTPEERALITKMEYGDVDRADQQVRQHHEVCWTRKRAALSETCSAPLDPTLSFMVLGTNGRMSFALEAVNETAIQSLHRLDQILFEDKAAQICKTLTEACEEVKTQKQARTLLNRVQALTRTDRRLAESFKVAGISAQLTRLLKDASLPDTDEKRKEFPPRKDLDGCTFTVHANDPVSLMAATPTSPTTGSQFRLWTHVATKEKEKSNPWKAGPFIDIQAGTIPFVTFNTDYCAVVHETAEHQLQVDVRLMECAGTLLSKRPYASFLIPPIDAFGQVSVHLSDDTNRLTISIGNTVTLMEDVSHHPVMVHTFLFPMPLTFAKCFPLNDILIAGTGNGICLGLEWKTRQILFVEATPLKHESISQVLYSNYRLFLLTATAVTCFPFPYLAPNYSVCFNANGVFGLDACGNILFTLDGDGAIQLFVIQSQEVFPFPAISFTTPKRPHYRALCAGATDELTVLYPDGVVRHVFIRTRAIQTIEKVVKKKDKRIQ